MFNFFVNKKIQAENKQMKDALIWLRNDMLYKAPEQVFDLMRNRWIPYIEKFLDKK